MGVRKTQEAKLLEGRGKGEGIYYIPWSRPHEFGSKGTCVRIMGWKVRRIYYFHSILEFHVFMLLQWEDAVKDIKEQFPLPINETIEIANELGIRHPTLYDKVKKRTEEAVRTVDFIITKEVSGIKIDVARTVKYSGELNDENVMKKFLIEKEYFNRWNIDYGIITEQCIDRQKAQNIESLYNWFFWDEYKHFPSDLIGDMVFNFGRLINKNGGKAFEAARGVENLFKLQENEGLDFLKYTLAHKFITVDMSIPLNYKNLEIRGVESNYEYFLHKRCVGNI